MPRPPFRSQIILATGISLGDEGKGRLIPELIEEIEEMQTPKRSVGAIVKVNGGANSGHTVKGLKLNLIPAGVVCPQVPCLALASGVVADPRKLYWESQYTELHGYDVKTRLFVDERTMVSDCTHRVVDLAWEYYREHDLGDAPRGSTGRGISPAYGDETGHFPIYFGEFLEDRDRFTRRLEARAERARRIVRDVCRVSEQHWSDIFTVLTAAEERANAKLIEAGKMPATEFSFHQFAGSEPFSWNLEAIVEAYWQAGQYWRQQIIDVREDLLHRLDQGEYIIGEFGQAFWLDKRHGFAPNVTASHTTAPEFFHSAGIAARPTHTIGVCKAYDTKVGTHTFICQFPEQHPLGRKLSQIEFGVSTGRQRMVGWFDAVEKGDALRYGGSHDLMINKLDALSYDSSGPWQGGELLICTAYRDPDGRIREHVPRNFEAHQQLQPVYRQYPGWSEDISKVRTFDNLPLAAKRYTAGMLLHTLRVAFGEPAAWPSQIPGIRYLGVGPDPSQIIRDLPSVQELLQLEA